MVGREKVQNWAPATENGQPREKDDYWTFRNGKQSIQKQNFWARRESGQALKITLFKRETERWTSSSGPHCGPPASQESGQQVDNRKWRAEVIDSAILAVEKNFWVTSQESHWRGLEHEKVAERPIKSTDPSGSSGPPAAQESGQEVDRRKCWTEVIDSAVLAGKKDLLIKDKKLKRIQWTAQKWKAQKQARINSDDEPALACNSRWSPSA